MHRFFETRVYSCLVGGQTVIPIVGMRYKAAGRGSVVKELTKYEQYYPTLTLLCALVYCELATPLS
jgi:hypothetical protein